jgi:hypothetical protein
MSGAEVIQKYHTRVAPNLSHNILKEYNKLQGEGIEYILQRI